MKNKNIFIFIFIFIYFWSKCVSRKLRERAANTFIMLRLSLGARPRRAVVGSIRPLRALSTLPSNGPTSQSAAHAQAARDPESYWRAMSAQIDWVQPPGQAILDGSRKPFYRWFPDATLNTCFNAVDRHVAAGHGARVAIYYDSPVTQQRKAVTYAELQTHVATVAGMLAAHGVGKGDRVMLYMPMVPEAIYGMLACARLGAVHSVVFGGFASKVCGLFTPASFGRSLGIYCILMLFLFFSFNLFLAFSHCPPF